MAPIGCEGRGFLQREEQVRGASVPLVKEDEALVADGSAGEGVGRQR